MTKWNTESFIKRSKEIHGNLYDYSKVEYKSYNEKVLIIDPEYGEFEQSPANHLIGKGSSKRAKQKLSNKFSLITEEFIEKSRKVHGDLYDYSKVNYINSKIKVIIIDKEYGEFEQTPNKHLQGQGNPIRGFNNQIKSKTIGNEKFIEKSRKVHGDLYDYSKVEYTHGRIDVIIIDPVYGEFKQKPELHLRGAGNPKRITTNKVKDHIIPLSIIMSSKERISGLYKDRPLFKLLNSQRNFNHIAFSKNVIKSDKIILHGEIYSAKNYRNNYNVISVLLEDIVNKKEIHNIINLDKKYMESIVYGKK